VEDANIDTIKKRFVIHEEQELPIIRLFEQQGKCRTIDASADVDAVTSVGS
jgi:adenylate kinase family enzyme